MTQHSPCWRSAPIRLLVLVFSLVFLNTSLSRGDEKSANGGKRVVFVAGSPSHGYGSHEHYAGCKILAETLQNSGLGIETEVVRGWPTDPQVLQRADSIVIYCDGGGGHVSIPHREELGKLMDAGKGLVCLHYAVEVPKGEVGDDFLAWLGGYFETDWSVNPHWDAEFKTLPELAVTRGVKPFTANDEWYFHMRFRPEMAGVTPVLSAVAPESTMLRADGPHSGNPDVRKAVAQGIPQTVAWIFERPNGGRSFGFTGGHYHWNWGRPEILKLVTNAIAWTSGATVPETGVTAGSIPVRHLLENQDYDVPTEFDPKKVAEEFKLSSLPTTRRNASPEEKAVEDSNAKKLYASPVVTSATKNHSVSIDVALQGTRDLYLVANDGGNGFACDWADWVNPRLVGPQGELSLLDLKWADASSQWGQVNKNRNAGGQPLSVAGKPIAVGIGTHANSVIHFAIPAGYESFRAEGALDTGGTSQNNGGGTSVQFLVYANAVPRNVGGGDTADNSQHAAANALTGITLPDDLEATLVASEPDLRSLTNLDIDDRGRIWVIDVVNYRGNNGQRPEGDRILILEDLDHDGVADDMKVFYQGRDIDSAMGLCVLGNQVIVSAAPNIWKFIDEDGDDRADKKIAMFTETGQPQHDHSDHSFLFGPDGKLYWNVGNTGQVVKDAEGKVVVDIHGRPIIDNGKPFFGGMPFRCDMDGSHMEVLAHNFRNNWETTVDSFGSLWQSDNDDDGNRGVRINFVMEHGNYGYRDEMNGGSWQQSRIGMEKEIPLQHWHLNDPGVVPNLLQTGAGSPTGICVYEGRMLPERFWDQVIHCDAGPNVVRAYPVQADGAGYTATMEAVMTGDTDKWFRPADVCVAPDGSLFVTDWYDPGVGGHQQRDLDRGRLFRVAPPGEKYVVPKFDYSTPETAADALRNPNLSVRYRAWTALHEFGSKAEPALLKLWEDSNPRIRARALWLLGMIEGRGPQYVDAALADQDSDIRITGLRLAKHLALPLESVVAKVVADPSFAVLREAAIALRYCSAPQVPTLWSQLAVRYDGHDRWYLEALGIGADTHASECFAAWLKQVGNNWNTPAGRDIVWRSRAPEAADRLVSLIANQDQSLEETDRYFRALEFHAESVRQIALQKVIRSITDASSGKNATESQERNDAIIVRAVERIPGMDWRADDAVREAVLRHLASSVETPQFLDLVKRLKPDGMEAEIAKFALAHADASGGVEAIGILLNSQQGKTLVNELLVAADSAPRIAKLLGLLGNQAAIDCLRPILKDEMPAYDVRAAAIRALSSNNLGSQLVLELAAENTLQPDVRLLASDLLSRHSDEAVRRKAAEVLPRPTEEGREPLPSMDQLAEMRGDVARGLELFRNKATCANCHIVSGFGKQVGPDLSEIGDKLSREALVVSILDPSAGISHNYENFVCLLDSGQVVAGVKVNETEEFVTLRTAEAIDRQIDKKVIEELKKSDKSIMPENLHHAFDTQGLIDVVEYLTTLKKVN